MSGIVQNAQGQASYLSIVNYLTYKTLYNYMGKCSQLRNHIDHSTMMLFHHRQMTCVGVRIIIFKAKMDFEHLNIHKYDQSDENLVVVIIVQLLQMLSPLMIIIRTRLHLDLKANEVLKEYG